MITVPGQSVVKPESVVMFTPDVVVQQHPIADGGPGVWRVMMFWTGSDGCIEGGSYPMLCRAETVMERFGRTWWPLESTDPCRAKDRGGEFCFYDATQRCTPSPHHDPPGFIEGPILGVAPFREGPWRIGHIGMGEGSLDLWIASHFPEVTVDAVEISSSMVELSRSAFGLPEGDHLRVHNDDGKKWLLGLPRIPTFDAFHLGAHDKHNTAGMYTVEFFSEVRARLLAHGRMSIMANIVDNTGVATMRGFLLEAGFSSVIYGSGPFGTTVVGFQSPETAAYFGLPCPGCKVVPKNQQVTRFFPAWTWQ